MNTISKLSIDGDLVIPELLRNYPSTRSVLDRYGLKGCGGPEGPYETLRVFARAHGVELQRLLSELSTSACAPASDAIQPAAQLSDVIYKRFFIAAILFLMTLGASWGAHILFKIGRAGSLAAASQLHIQAHAQAQVFGWMSLVIMGFAYQAFPRFWHSSLRNPMRANLSFWLMTIGTVLASAGIFSTGLRYALPVTVIGTTLELAAAALFAWEIVETYTHSGKRIEPYMGYVFTAIGWFVAGSLFNVVHCWALVMSAEAPIYASYVASLQSPMRDIQFHGLATTMIIGVSLRTLPHIFGARQPGDRFSWIALAVLTSAIVLEVLAGLLGISSGPVPALLLLGVALASIWQFRLWRPFPDGDRSAKFIKAAWFWLVISLIMSALTPVYAELVPAAGSHAYQGAIRHALTVGFISLMIMGYAAKVVATLNGYDIKTLTKLMVPFVLVNFGCALRVAGQTVSDSAPSIFPLMGLSGIFETAGMILWGAHIVRLIAARRKPDISSTAPTARIGSSDIVANIVTWYPQTLKIFTEFGFTALNNPVLRRTGATQVTLKQACRMHNLDVDLFVRILNEAIAPQESCAGCTGDGCGREKSEKTDGCH